MEALCSASLSGGDFSRLLRKLQYPDEGWKRANVSFIYVRSHVQCFPGLPTLDRRPFPKLVSCPTCFMLSGKHSRV